MRILLLFFLFISPTLWSQTDIPANDNNDEVHQARAIEFPEDADWLNTSYPLTLKHFDGKFILLNFWTSSSMLSTAQLNELKRLQEIHRELEVVIVHSGKYNTERSTEYIRKAIIEHDIHFPVVNDSTFSLWRDYNVDAWPTNILIDPEGNIALQSQGVSIEGDVSAHIELYSGDTKKTGSPVSSEIHGFQQGLLVFPKFIESDGHFSLFISEFRGHRIVQTDFNNTFEHYIGTGKEGFRDGDLNNAQFRFPGGLAFHPSDSLLYIADTGNDAIRKYNVETGQVSTVLGTGERAMTPPELVVETTHALNQPTGLTLIGDDLYIAMTGWNQIWKLDTQTGIAEPVAGSGTFGFEDGKNLKSNLAEPYGITHDPDGVIYFTERQSSAVRTFKKGKVKTLLGTGIFDFGDEEGGSKTARLQGPAGIFFHDDALYVADQFNNKIKRVDPYSGRSETFLGSGTPDYQNGISQYAAFNNPTGVTVLLNHLFITDTYNQVVRQHSFDDGSMVTYNFLNLDQMQFNPIDEFQVFETDTIQIPPGESSITMVFELDSLWKLETDAPQSALVTSRNPGIIEDPYGINPETQSITFELDNSGEFRHFIAEVALIYHHEEEPELTYFRTFTLMVMLDISEDAPAEQEVVFKVPSSDLM